MQYPKKTLIFALALPLILSLLFVVPSTIPTALAATRPHTIEKNNGVGALAQWPAANLGIAVVKDQFGTDITLFDPSTNALLGGQFFTTNVFQTTNNFGTATLIPVTINICTATGCGDVIIQATWTATGTPITLPNQSTFTFPGGVMHFTGVNIHVPATATGSLNGHNLGQSLPGGTQIFKFKTVEVDIGG